MKIWAHKFEGDNGVTFPKGTFVLSHGKRRVSVCLETSDVEPRQDVVGDIICYLANPSDPSGEERTEEIFGKDCIDGMVPATIENLEKALAWLKG